MPLSKVIYYVHCHLCPLKDICPFAEPDASYTYQKTELLEQIPRQIFEKLGVATLNCPLKKALSYFGFL